MKRKNIGNYVALIALLVAPLAAFGMNPKTHDTKSAISGKSLLALLGAGCSAYGAYHVYQSPELSGKVKENFEAGCKWAGDHNVRVGFGLAALTAASYLGYRWMTSEKDIVIDTPSLQVPNAPVTRSTQPARVAPQAAPEVPAWYSKFASFIDEGSRAQSSSDEESRVKAAQIRKLVGNDPYNILKIESFVEGLTIRQRSELLHIFLLYKRNRVVQVVTALERNLRPEQDGVKALLQEAIAAGPTISLVALQELDGADYLSQKQAQFVRNELAYYNERTEIEANYKVVYLSHSGAAVRR